MTEAIESLIQRYGPRGILVDTNILLLYVVGSFDPQLIPRFKRTRQFTVEDFQRLAALLGRFRAIVTTPHVLSEVNSLSSQLTDPAKSGYFAEFARRIVVLDEHYVASRTVAQLVLFPRLGLTDVGILHLSKGGYLVLTDDSLLCRFLENAGVDVLNFNYLRAWSW